MKFGTGKLDIFQKCRGIKKSRKAMLDAMHNELETTFKKNMRPENISYGCIQQYFGSYRRLDLTDPGKLSGNGCDV